ncbi:MAG: hypothetical protein K9N07_11115 [Candidatus Cloacimonetes bacterium]|nr:hypothetical protein [Candidatus Cloacimonadota bacterium]
MNRDELFNKVHNTFSQVLDKVEEVRDITSIKLRISSLKNKIHHQESEIGQFVKSHKKQFLEFPDLKQRLDKIKLMEEQISALKKQITSASNKNKDNDAKSKKHQSAS